MPGKQRAPSPTLDRALYRGRVRGKNRFRKRSHCHSISIVTPKPHLIHRLVFRTGSQQLLLIFHGSHWSRGGGGQGLQGDVPSGPHPRLQPAALQQREGTCGGQGRPGGTVFSSEGWRGRTPKGCQGCLQALTPSWLLALGGSAQSWGSSWPEDGQNAGLSLNGGLLQVHRALTLTTAQTHLWVPPERPLGTPTPGVLNPPTC